MEETAVEFPSHCGNFTLRGTLSRGRGHRGRDGVCLLLHGGMVRVCAGSIIIMHSIHTENACMSSMQPWQNSTQCVMNTESSWTTRPTSSSTSLLNSLGWRRQESVVDGKRCS
jgi:hypothetical protein